VSDVAREYVMALTKTPNGERLTRSEKFLLLCLADYHNRYSKIAFPSVQRLALDTLSCEREVRYLLRSLERKGLIIAIRPGRQGRGGLTHYVFLELDPNPGLEPGGKDGSCSDECRARNDVSKKAARFAAFSSRNRSSAAADDISERRKEGGNPVYGRRQEGGKMSTPNKEEPGTKVNKEPEPCADGVGADPRAEPIRSAIQRLQQAELGYVQWDGSAAAALRDLLGSTTADVRTIVRAAVWRALSARPMSEHPRAWVRRLLDYSLGPLDERGRHSVAGERDPGGHIAKAEFERLFAIALPDPNA
jgi:hypothetical protein